MLACPASWVAMDGDFGLLFQSAHDAVDGFQEVLFAHELLAVACGYQGGLVADVGDVRARESRCLAGQQVHVHCVVYLDGAHMHAEDVLAFVQVGQIHVYLSVEASGTQQGFVQHVHAVGGSQDNDTAVRAEAVHFGQQLVQRVLAFIVAAHGCCFGTGTAHGVDFVDEDDAGRLLLGLAEEVAHTGCTHADEHLYKVRACQREERYVRLACHGLGQQGLTRARRTDQQSALGNLSTQFGIFLRLLQELHDFFHLLFGSGQSGHVLEGDFGRVAAFLEQLGA